MPHEIWGQRFVSTREPAWHRIGFHFAEPILPSEAVAIAGFEEPELAPLFLEDGTPVDYYAVVMGDEVFGVVSRYWRLFRLEEIVPTLDELSRTFPLSAAGQLKKGRIVFFAFEQRTEILGEDYIRYLVVLHSYEPGRSWKVLYTPTRVVCMNTLVASEKDREWEYRVYHNAPRGILEAQIVMAQYRVLQETVDKKLEAFARIGDFDAQIDVLFEHVYPYPEPPSELDKKRYGKEVEEKYERAMERVKQVRNLALQSYQRFNDEFPKFGNTAYAALQAVTEVADWRGNLKSKESPLIGLRAKEKQVAWQFLSTLI